ncbi:MAG TPA: pantoate--beta-alanine ligase [Hungateiclostridium thermocellum]|jgi:pantoate--beta-alanine ligase|uniref:Pantothenate synthetase n=2 Tax=Acetivibrio thermocellus TaxID=1515 RepID=PANC_ACET2|nr:pantoate--beta-alanine ligase [Acetivibrio thermocellus]A3DDV6.1 RecName: Full=Pantothenate synthetase; Short=PS; AltName: Full=Pantoate--beta-alanine ligase; AltName: Full=Pantoate-activating enzyme [Acetivibrio thermocellus ATCC 27405]ABN52135.1 pantoate/beta-alanine ligase [Acetivibrio thermocellus ATCC 27405]ADU74380.1 pantoate/beta-alanine ligase [Acetivibrio thermocellus DSM 1313]ALX08323.1 Pantothenate synthetase [Acetivibrio thermocellus AD2]ANV76071.1 Pantothenate synthetase [Aceti
MRVIETISDLKAIIRTQKNLGRVIGLVPTMGYLHEGHLSLVNMSRQNNDYTVMSIFVNPTQFGPNEDFDRYPRDLERDLKLAEAAGVDVVFAPSVKEMYPDGYKTYVNVEGITEVLCGKSRPGHFRGVTTIVTKLFNIVEPHRAYFGQKDAQQVAVIKKMVKDLNMNVEIITCPIVREEDGLAMSSRNVYLSPEERKSAVILSKSLMEAEELIKKGETDAKKIRKYIIDRIQTEKNAVIDYVEVVNADTLENVDEIKGRVLVALAVKFGSTRLIDNVIVEV